MTTPTTNVNTIERGIQHLRCPVCGWKLTVYYDEKDKAIELAYAHDRKHARKDDEKQSATTAHVVIWHRNDQGRMTSWHLERATWERAYSYDTDRVDLEEIWRDNNRVDGGPDEEVSRHATRSMCTGDVASIDGALHFVLMTGWQAVDSFDAITHPIRCKNCLKSEAKRLKADWKQSALVWFRHGIPNGKITHCYLQYGRSKSLCGKA